ncbi:MAG: ATP-binding cassette domain-containing protein, partial [Candidatus Bipolaricaulota bacterium]
LGALLRSDVRQIRADLDRVYAVFPEIAGRSSQVAGTLSGGEQQMVAIGRALMTRPKIILVDELSLGLAPVAVDRIATRLSALHKEDNVAVLLVEQDASLALELAERGYVLESGVISLSGPAAELLGNDAVRRSYLGL